MRLGIDFGTTHTVAAVVDRGNYPVASFDGIDTWPSLPAEGQPPLIVTRTYRAAHNIGHFRFVECSRLRDGHPDGEVTPYDPVLFPFDPDLRDVPDLVRRPVQRCDDGPDVEERYVVTPGGAVEVTLTTRPARLSRTFRLARHDLASA